MRRCNSSGTPGSTDALPSRFVWKHSPTHLSVSSPEKPSGLFSTNRNLAMLLLKDKIIFIVEDNSQNRVIFKMTLIKHGAIVDFERSGQDTIFRLKSASRASPVNLIILDLMLTDGISG